MRHLAGTILGSVALLVTVAAQTTEERSLEPGDIVVGSGGGSGLISIFGRDGSLRHTLPCDCAAIRDLTLDADGRIVALAETDEASRTVLLVIDVASGAAQTIAGDLASPGGLAVGADQIVVTTNDGAGGRVLGIEPDTGAERVVLEAGSLVRAGGVDIAADGAVIVAGDLAFEDGVIPGVVAIDRAGALRTVALGDVADRLALNVPVDVVVGGDGTIYVLDMRPRGGSSQDEGRILAVDPETGSQTLLTMGIEGTDRGTTDRPFVGLDIDGEVLYVVDLATGSPFGGVNSLDTEAFRSITAESVLEYPSGLAVVPGGADAGGDAGLAPGARWLLVPLLAVVAAVLAWAAWRRRREPMTREE